MEAYQSIDEKIQKGYEYILKKQQLKGCDQWLEAWSEIIELFEKNEAKDIYELNKKYDWTQFISNYAQDLEMELHNAGIEDNRYHEKRIKYCQELLKWCGNDEIINKNTQRAIADAYFGLGDTATGDHLFTEWLNDDPDWGWGYIGWSDNYWMGRDNRQYEKAIEILMSGYSRESVRDKIDIVERIIDLYKAMGHPGKAAEYRPVLLSLQHNAPKGSRHYKPKPVRVEKTGRNEPCPCGSGKKYKKCCGA